MYKDISLAWQNQNQDLCKMSEEINQIDFGLERLQRCLGTQFKLVSFMTQTQHHVNKLYKNPQQFPLNRNAAYMTFDPSRVYLGTQQDKQKIENYINANYIQIQDKRAIATQGPLTNSFYNFWRMIQQNNVSSIFMLCNLMEKTKLKCDKYYAQKDPNANMIKLQEYEINLLEQTENIYVSSLKIKKLQLKNNKTGISRVVTHYHVLDWPDGDLPKSKGLKCINYLIDVFLNNINQGDTPVVHCSAGVGRTGTFMAMAILRKLIAQNKKISIFNEVRKIREQRWGMVHTLSQYEYLYDFCEKEIQKMINGISTIHSDSSEQIEQI